MPDTTQATLEEIGRYTLALKRAGIVPAVRHTVEQAKYITVLEIHDGFTRSTLQAAGTSAISPEDAYLDALRNFITALTDAEK